MPDERSPLEEARSENKSSGKHKWRGKLFSAEGKFGRNVGDLESTDDDVASFLQTATTTPKAELQAGGNTHRINSDPAPRSPAGAEVSEPPKFVDVYRRPKPRQNKGLRVTFEIADPEIIGEGGEKAELPSIQVSESLRDATASGLLTAEEPLRDIVDHPPQDKRGHSAVPDHEPSSRPTPLQRRPTGLSDIFGDEIWADRDHDSGSSPLSSSVSLIKSKPLPQPPPQTQDNGGYETQETYQDASLLENKRYDIGSDNANRKTGEINDSVSSYLDVPSPEILAGNSLTPNPSPEPPSGYGFPPTVPSTQLQRKPLDSKPPVRREVTKMEPAPAALEPKAYSLRSVAKSLGDDSLEEFDGQVRRFNDIFCLGISAHVDLMQVSFEQWIMISTWWFIMGRQGLESEVRSHVGLSPTLKQAYVNLAKAWWIVKEVTPNHPEVTRYGKASMNSLCAIINSFGNHALAELAEVHLNLVAHMRALTMSMKRNEKLPPPDLEIRGLDLHVLLQFPSLPPDIARLTVNNSSGPQAKGRPYIAKPFFPILIGDTGRHFSFARMFVEVGVLSSDNGKQDTHIPCVLSVLRERDEWGVEVAIASQDTQVNLVVSDGIAGGLTWKRVKWEIVSHEMMVRASDDMEIKIKFSEKEFKILWGICDYTQRIRKRFLAHKDEDLVFERILEDFQCDDAAQFPSGSVRNCRLRIFEKKSVVSDGTSQRRTQNGYRLAVITPPSLKTLSSVNYDLGREYPILFGIPRGNDASRLVLRLLPSSIRLSLSFREAEDLDSFRRLLSGTATTKEDHHFPSLQLQRLVISAMNTNLNSPVSHIGDLPWSKLRVVNKGPPPYGHDTLSTVGSEHLRILADCGFGIFTDRINLARGELQLSLSVTNFDEIKLLRPPQSDMLWSLSDHRVAKEELDLICETLRKMLTSPTVRCYNLSSMTDLHGFQAMITGFRVLYDKVVSTFAISRRRMVVPISKRWEASSVRLQVIKRDKIVQLVAFFKDFSHGSCMNFALRFTDTFETFNKTGLFYLRIVDAKFALPKGQEDESREFVCLDMPEYPGEHDDVTIGFNNEQDRDRFGEALPAPVNKMSRMASLRR